MGASKPALTVTLCAKIAVGVVQANVGQKLIKRDILQVLSYRS
jgi:hypothetical protein